MPMGAFLPPVVAELLAEVGKFTAGFGVAKAEMSSFEAATTRMAAAGKVAMGMAVVGMAAIAFESVKLGAAFDQTMELIHTQAGASQSEVDGLKGKVLDLAAAVGIGPEKLAQGLYHIESTGLRDAAALDVLNASAKLTAIGLADLDTVTYSMSGVMSTGLKDVRNAADATAYLNQIVGMGDMKMQQLAAAIGTGALPAFKSAGLGLMDFGAALATVSDNSTPPEEGATRLRMTVSLLASPSHEAAKALGEIGLSSTQLANDLQQPNGLLVAVMDLKHHLEASGKTAVEQNQIIERAFGGGRTSSTIQTLLLESDRLKDKYHELGDASSRAAKFNEAWNSQQRQFSQQLHQVGAELQVVGVKVGEFLIPYIQRSTEWLSKHTEVVKIAALVIGGILVAAMVAFTASVIASTVALLANPVTWIIIAIIAAVALLAVGIYELVTHWGTVWGFIKRISLDVWHWLVDAWHATWNTIMGVVDWIRTNIIDRVVRFFDDYLVKPVVAGFRFFVGIWRTEWNVIGGIADFALGFLSTVFTTVRNRIMTILHPAIVFFRDAWDEAWGNISMIVNWANDHMIQPAIRYITKGIDTVKGWIHDLQVGWGIAWKAISDKVVEAWTVLRYIWGLINTNGIQPIHHAISWLGDQWNKIWNAIRSAVSAAWSFLRPIFDAISGAIDKIISGIRWIADNPGKAGSSLAHHLGFDAGGWVPGPHRHHRDDLTWCALVPVPAPAETGRAPHLVIPGETTGTRPAVIPSPSDRPSHGQPTEQGPCFRYRNTAGVLSRYGGP